MVNPGEKMATASELLGKVLEGARFNNIQLKDVEELLANEIFTKEMLATSDKRNTLLHLAAMGKVEAVLPLVVQAYKRAKLFPAAMATLNKYKHNPLHMAIMHCSYENTVLLLKECRESCSQAMAAMEDGCTLLHMAADCAENVDLVDFFLSPENAELTEPMLLAVWTVRNRDMLPVNVAWNVMRQAEQSLDFAQKHVDQFAKTTIMKQTMQRSRVDPKKKVLDKAKRIHAAVDQATKKAKAREAEKLLKEMEAKKRQEREEQLRGELNDLLQANNWSSILEKYLLSDSEETQELTINCLAKDRDSEDSSDTARELPAPSAEISRVFMHFLEFPEDQQVVLSSLTLLDQFLSGKENCQLLLGSTEGMDVASKVVALLCSLNVAIQHQCATILVSLTTSKPDSFVIPDGWIQALLLIKHFSLYPTTKSLAEQALTNIGSTHPQPDPGSWGVRDVSLWMESNTSLDKRAEYRKSFAEAGIDGLHLLELSATEMTGLGVKFVYDQRKLSSLIDELRRMNMRSIVGRKDIFLSYAHINIKFGREIKRALTDGKYSVWIDEAGIRAGQKWRNEIADGIQGCRAVVFIMTPRSANSVYCQDELAMAEEYKKPIITVKLQVVEEIDPGLKLMIQRRQWIDFSDDSQFEAKCGELLRAVCSTIGEPSGTDGEEDHLKVIEHTPETTKSHVLKADYDATDSGTLTLASLQEVVRTELAKLGTELKEQMDQLREHVQRLESKVDQLLQARERT